MTWPVTIGTSIAFLIAVSLWCLFRVRREFGQDRSTPTAVLVWVIYTLHLGIIFAVSVVPLWPLPIPWLPRLAFGGLLLAAGVILAGLGMLNFGSIRRMSGKDTGRLMTEGIYAWSRNPQNVGWIAAQFGIAILGGSALGLLMSTLFAVLFLVYVGYEERHLQSIFGDAYLAYTERSHRIFGPPRNEQLPTHEPRPQPAPRPLGDSPRRQRKVSPVSTEQPGR